MDRQTRVKPIIQINTEHLKKVLPQLGGILILFIFLAIAYFAPAVFEGRELFQQDVAGASGNGSDVHRLAEATGEVSYWTNSLFGGMPMYQISPSYPSLYIISKIQGVLTLQWPFCLLPGYSWLLFAMLGGFYLFLRAMRVGRWPSVLGAVMWTFSSYFIILITAGHIWKLMTLAFIPPTIAGIVYSYRGRYLVGGALTALFASLQLLSNHVQMSYYFAFLILFILGAYLWEAIRTKKLRRFVFGSLVTLGAGLIALGINSSNLYHTYEYGSETIRGGSELTPSVEDKTSGGVEATSAGLDKEYITAWSYGKGETLTLLVPNAYGGATGELKEDLDAMEHIPSDYKQILGGLNHYWGDQPFTAGPVYVGAFVLFLFILGAFIVKGPLKRALLVGTLFSIFLAWGHNMMWLTDLFIDHVPLYNKFRTVSSILVVAEFTIPALAVLGLIQFVREPKEVVANRVALGVSLALTLGVALILALVPGTFFSLMSEQEQAMFRQAMGDGQLPIPSLMAALKDARASIVSADAWRSVFVLLLSLGACVLYYWGKIKAPILYLLVGVITLGDLWLVDKRYLNDEHFIDKDLVAQQARPVTEADRTIMADKDPHYRVMNLAVNSFNDATTSANHRSVGGYHAAKLRRYQDLIEHQLSKQNMQVYNMLDTRYFILPDRSGALHVERNEEAFGAAWFVNEVQWVGNADEEMKALDDAPLRSRGIIDERFRPMLKDYQPIVALDTVMPEPTVELRSYAPNRATYHTKTEQPRLLIFSEVYYPHGWHLILDGKEELPILRANYVLRAAYIPAGEHQLEMVFDPKSIHRTELAANVSSALLVLLILGALASLLFPSLHKAENKDE